MVRHENVKAELEVIRLMTAVFDSAYIKNTSGPNVKTGKDKMDLAEQFMAYLIMSDFSSIL